MKISIIIPAYNAERYIAQAIESCFKQTLLPDEIVVVDDASTDRTFEIARSFPAPVKAIRLAANSGASVARNRAVEASTGDWLAFLDADDWFFPRKLELQRRCIVENPEAVLVYCGVRMKFLDGSEKDAVFVPPDRLQWWLRYSCAFHSTSPVMVRRDAFDAVGGFDPYFRNAQDWDLWLRIADRFSTAAFAAVTEPEVMYRQVAGSLSSNRIRRLKYTAAVVESRSLYKTSGLRRNLLRRRILAFHYFDVATALREEDSPEYFGYIIRSLALWPLPFPREMLPVVRYRIAAVMLLQHLGWWPNSFRLRDAPSTSHRGQKG